MAKTVDMYIRIDPEVKADVENIYAQYGMSITDAINVFLYTSRNPLLTLCLCSLICQYPQFMTPYSTNVAFSNCGRFIFLHIFPRHLKFVQ